MHYRGLAAGCCILIQEGRYAEFCCIADCRADRERDWFQEVCVVHFDRVRILGVRDRARADHHVPRADGCGAAGAVHPVHGLRV